jgi:26S proteasome regulatory subunit N8
MLAMFRKVNAKERVVGFYSTGPQIRPNDLRIYDIVERYTGSNTTAPAVFCIIDIRPDRPDLPVTSYRVTEEVSTFAGGGSSNNNKDRQVHRTFAHVHSSLGAMEAEEVGVEHLLRDINDPTVSTVASLIKGKLSGLTTLGEKLLECKHYLEACARGECAVNNDIIFNLQTILSLLPNLNNEQLVRSMMLKTNDMYMAIYLAALIRSVIALHDLVNNKIRYGEDGTEYKEIQNNKTGKIAVEEEKKNDKSNNTKKDAKTDSSKKKE